MMQTHSLSLPNALSLFLSLSHTHTLSLTHTHTHTAPAAERESYSDKQLSYSRVGRKSITPDNKIAIEFL